jgi:hypothetical protein
VCETSRYGTACLSVSAVIPVVKKGMSATAALQSGLVFQVFPKLKMCGVIWPRHVSA